MQGCLRRAAEWHCNIQEIRVLRCPLIGLAGAHGPAHDGAQVRDAEVLGDELVLGADIVVE